MKIMIYLSKQHFWWIKGGAAMRFEDEKDYIMRMIKEMVSVLFSIIFVKQFRIVGRKNQRTAIFI